MKNITRKYINTYNINNYDDMFLSELLDEFMPLNNNEKKWFASILLSNRCKSIDEYKKLLLKIRNFPNKNNNKEWFDILYDNESAWQNFLSNRIKKFKDNTANRFDIEDQCLLISNNINKEITRHIDVNIIYRIILNFYPLSNMERKWIVKIFNNFEMNEEQYIIHINKVRNFDGIKSENIEWLSLLYNAEDVTIKLNKKSNRMKGSKNHFYNHKGIYSIWSSNCLNPLSENEKSKIKELLSFKRKNDFKNNVFLPSYYKSIDEYKEFQRKDLKYYINKYGDEKGISVYNKKKLIWSYSRKSKSKDINYLIKEFGCEKCIFYIIKISSNIIKIGITTKSISERYRGKTYEILYSYESNLHKCLEEELQIKKLFYKHSIKPSEKIDGFGVTESYYIDIYEEILSRIKKDA